MLRFYFNFITVYLYYILSHLLGKLNSLFSVLNVACENWTGEKLFIEKKIIL